MESGILGFSKNVRKWGVKFVDLLRAELCANWRGLRYAAQFVVSVKMVLRYFFMSLLNLSACPFDMGW